MVKNQRQERNQKEIKKKRNKRKVILNVNSCGYLSKPKLQEIKQRANTNEIKIGYTRQFSYKKLLVKQ